MYREHTEFSERNSPSNRGLSIAIYCAMAIVAIVVYTQSQSGQALTGANNMMVGCLLAAFAGAVSLFAWVISRKSIPVQTSGVWQLIEGMSTLVPPAVIAMTILPLTPEMRPWVLGGVLVAGCFGLIFLSDLEFSDGRTHKFHRREYLFDQGLGNSFLKSIDVVEPATDLQYRERPKPIEREQPAHRAEPGYQAPQPASAVNAPVIDGQLRQQISRFIANNGDDRVEATWNVHFELDQKRTVVHVPFSPAFSTRPNVECSLIDGDGVTLKVAEVHPYGVRIEARRTHTDRPADITIGFHASAKPGSKNRADSPSPFRVARSERIDPEVTRVNRPIASGVDSEFSLGNPAELVRQPGERISRTTGPHNPPGRVPLDPGLNSISRAS